METYTFLVSLFLYSSSYNLELLFCIFSLVAIVAFWLSPGGLAWALSKYKNPKVKTAIPGPSGYPLLGMITCFSGSSLPHRVLAKLSKSFKAKSLMAFSVGLTKFVISSDPLTAKELLNSSAFADRPIKESAYELLFHRAMGFAPYGEYWRNLRRVSATHLFSPKRVTSFGKFRQEIGVKMVSEIMSSMRKNNNVEVRKVLHFGSLNNVMKTVFGKFYEFNEGGEGDKLEKMVAEGYDLLGVFNWGDHFPLVRMLDLQGVRRRCKSLVEKVNVYVENIIQEHREKRAESRVGEVSDDSDFVDVLLDLENENKIVDSDMVAVLWEMIFRGTDTVAILLEWILARMVMYPHIQAKAQAEIDTIVGTTKLVSDSDLANLLYLHAIVKETLRIHPPGPLLSWARLSIHDTYIGHHFIPAGSTTMVNMWAITHDASVWSNPNEFNPERFIKEDIQIFGSALRLAPFGSGRRVCPGKAMGIASVELWLAQLLQCFKWVPDTCGVDLSEILKLSLEMKNSLACKAIPRNVATSTATI